MGIEKRPRPPRVEYATEYGTPERFLEHLSHERYQCIDDLPKELVQLLDPNYYLYKCRTNWWHRILNQLVLMKALDIADEGTQLNNDVDNFISFIETIDTNKFRTREEIDRANRFLDQIIAQLESKISSS